MADPAMREFKARLGPDGGQRGYSAMTGRMFSTLVHISCSLSPSQLI